MNLLGSAVEDAEGEAAVQYVQLEGPVLRVESNTTFCGSCAPESANGVTLYMSPGFLVPWLHHK